MTTSHNVSPQPGASGGHDIALAELVLPLRRGWKLIVGICLLFVAAGVAIALLLPSIYTAQATFTPESPNTASASGLAGLAGQLGLANVGGGSVTPAFFIEVLRSDQVLAAALQSEFPDPAAPAQAKRPLLDILEVEGDSLSQRVSRGIRQVKDMVEATADRGTSIVTLEVRHTSPELAAALANRMIELLNEFNLERRQSQSGAERRFTGERVQEAERALRQAEQAQLRFLQSNRTFGSPMLQYEASRLERDVQIQQEKYLALTRAHTEARIAEVRDTPVLTVIDSARVPDRKSSPRRMLIVVIAALAGAVTGSVLAYLRR